MIGPPNVVFEVADRVAEAMRGIGLRMQRHKCQWWSKDPAPAQTQERSQDYTRGGSEETGWWIQVAGVPVGDDRYVHDRLTGKTTKACEAIKQITHALLPWSNQALVAVLRYCCQPMLNYEMRLLPPDRLSPHLKRFDEKM